MPQSAHRGSDIVVRLFQPADLPFADSLRALAGWNQTPKDWERLLRLSPEGCFVAEWQGRPAGTVTSIQYGPQLGWIGMLLVHPEYRRCGIGAALLQKTLDHLTDAGVRCVRLDATPLGKPLYERFGFQAEWSLTRWERAGSVTPSSSKLASSPSGTELRALAAADLECIAGMDAQAFGIDRSKVLRSFLSDCVQAVLHQSSSRDTLAYGLLREGCRALYLGPVIGTSAASAAAVIEHLLQASLGKAVFWDAPDLDLAGRDAGALSSGGEHNPKTRALAPTLGFKPQRELLRMRRGDSNTTARPDRQFAILDPALG